MFLTFKKFFWGLIFCVAGYAFSTTGYALLGLPLGGLGIWLVWNSIAAWNKLSVSKEKWTELVTNTQYQHFESDTGIAIDTKAKIIHLKSTTQIKSYPYSDIRSWRYNKSTGGEITAIGSLGGLASAQASAANLSNFQRNVASSGFYVTVKDIDIPEWRTAMYSEANMKKWMEIFEQHVNEK